jgi:hypothetical protein
VLFTPVPRERQAAAVRFLNENVFRTPAFLLPREILRRIEPQGALDRIKTAQRMVLLTLLDARRFGRLVEQEVLDGPKAYAPAAFLADLRAGIFSELAAPQIQVDAWRRNVQRLYLEVLADRLNGRTPAADDQRPFFRGELRSISAEIGRALPRVTDRSSRVHLEDLRDQIARALDPRFPPPAPAAATPSRGDRPSWEEPETCWPDLLIRPDP